MDEKPKRRFLKFNKTLQKAYLSKIAQGVNIYKACEEIGISRPTVIQFTVAHPEFQDEINEATIQKHQLVKDSLHRQACSDKNTTATIFYLQNHCSDEYKDRRAVADIKQNDLTQISTDEIKEELERRGIKISENGFKRISFQNLSV